MNLIYDVSPYESENFNFGRESLENFILRHSLNFAKISEKEDIKKFPKENFYHLCTIKSYLSVFITENNCLPISNEIIGLLKKYTNFNVIFLTENESDKSEVVGLLEKQIENYQLNYNQFILINDNEELENIKKNSNSKIIVHTANILQKKTLQILSNYKSDFNYDKKYVFMCHNRRLHPHRFGLLC